MRNLGRLLRGCVHGIIELHDGDHLACYTLRIREAGGDFCGWWVSSVAGGCGCSSSVRAVLAGRLWAVRWRRVGGSLVGGPVGGRSSAGVMLVGAALAARRPCRRAGERSVVVCLGRGGSAAVRAVQPAGGLPPLACGRVAGGLVGGRSSAGVMLVGAVVAGRLRVGRWRCAWAGLLSLVGGPVGGRSSAGVMLVGAGLAGRLRAGRWRRVGGSLLVGGGGCCRAWASSAGLRAGRWRAGGRSVVGRCDPRGGCPSLGYGLVGGPVSGQWWCAWRDRRRCGLSSLLVGFLRWPAGGSLAARGWVAARRPRRRASGRVAARRRWGLLSRVGGPVGRSVVGRCDARGGWPSLGYGLVGGGVPGPGWIGGGGGCCCASAGRWAVVGRCDPRGAVGWSVAMWLGRSVGGGAGASASGRFWASTLGEYAP